MEPLLENAREECLSEATLTRLCMENSQASQQADQNHDYTGLSGLKRPFITRKKRVLFVLAIVAFFMLVLEAISYFLLEQRDRYELRIFEHSEKGGVSGIGVKENFSQEWRTSEFCVTVRTNNVGLRENQDWHGGKIDIGFYGDSFTFGHGVEQEERYSDLLRASLPDRNIVSFSYLNGWTTPHYYNFMLKYPDMLPEIAILGLFLGNDLTSDMDETKIVLGADGDPLRVVATKRGVQARGFLVIKDRNFLTDLLSKSYLGEYILRSRVLDRVGLLRDLCEAHIYPPLSFDKGELSETNLLGLEYVKRMNEHLNAHNKRLVVFLIVWAYYVGEYPCDHGHSVAVDLRENQYLTKRIMGNLDKHMIEYINPVPRFKELENQGTQLYFKRDAHWNPKGHEIAAELISDYLRQSQWPKALFHEPRNRRLHLARVGETPDPVLGEHELAIDSDVEDSVGTLDEHGLGAESFLEVGRQTGGPGFVVSSSAVSDSDVHDARPLPEEGKLFVPRGPFRGQGGINGGSGPSVDLPEMRLW